MKAHLLVLVGALLLPGWAMAQADDPPSDQPSANQAPQTPAEKQKMHQEEKAITDAFRGQNNFEMDGVLLGADADHGSMVIQRGSMPMAFLIVPETAPVTVNGQKKTLADLQPGAKVKAKFNLVQQYPVALQVDAVQGAKAPPAPTK